MKKNCLFIFLFLIAVSPILAQTVNDAGLWTTLNLDKKLNDRFSIALTEELRLKENYSQFNSMFTECEVEHKTFSFLKTSASYRFTQKFKSDNSVGLKHRINFNLSFRKKFTDKFSLTYRQRIQTEFTEYNSSEFGKTPTWLYRHKFSFKYELNKNLSPYASYEARFQLYDPEAIEFNNLFNRNRYVIGLDYELNKKNNLGIYYLFQNEFNVYERANDFIIGIEYSISL